MRLIDADGVYQETLKYSNRFRKSVLKIINALPTVEPVRHGHWLLDSSGAEFCSECGEYPFDDGEYHISGWSSKYCPNCGAKMDGE